MAIRMNISILSFSGRSGGNCGRIAEEIRRYWSDRAEVRVFDFSTFSITPCGRCDCQCFENRERCPYFEDPEFALCQAVAGSGLAYFIVPNYCDYPCANFFIFNERGQCYFQHHPKLLEKYLAVPKKFVAVSNTNCHNFTAAFRYHIPESQEPDVLFLSARRFGKVSIRGDLMDAPEAREALREFIS